jgi:hypothetical protein
MLYFCYQNLSFFVSHSVLDHSEDMYLNSDEVFDHVYIFGEMLSFLPIADIDLGTQKLDGK